jgi:hypothetical protein
MLDWLSGALCFVLIPLLVVALAIRTARLRARTVKAAHAPTWSELTDGGLSAPHEGPLLTLWASGRLQAGSSRSTSASTLVAIDEVALAAVELQAWPRAPERAWLRREDDRPVLEVTNSWLGPAIVREGFGNDA